MGDAMNLEIVGRHIEITPAMRDFAFDKLRKLEKLLDGPLEVHLVLLVEKHRQPVVRRELVDRPECPVVGASRLAIGERSQVVVAQEQLADAAPDVGVLIVHPLDVPHSVPVGRVEAADQRVEAILLLGRK
jgi:ribosomal subunit interface protein